MAQAILKTDILYEQLREELGKYGPGDKFITSREIMKRYSVSQLIVDQTVARFRDAGLLRMVPGRGTFITEAVGRLRHDAPPTFLFAVPRWTSSDLTLLESYIDVARPEYVPNRLLVYRYDYTERVPAELPLEEENVRGVAVLTSADSWDSQALHRLESYAVRVPLVILDRHRGDIQLFSVGANDVLAGNLAADHLYRNGHRRIGVLISEPSNGVIRDRVRGVVDYAGLHGMECEVLDCNVHSGEYSPDKAYRYLSEIIGRGFSFTGLVGISTESFAGAVNACLNGGIRIPERLSMVTVGSRRIAEIQHPPLDCVDVNMEGQLHAALEILGHPDAFTPDGNPYEYFTPSLVCNGSTGILMRQ